MTQTHPQPCWTVVEYFSGRPEYITRIFGAFEDTDAGHELAQELLLKCLQNRREGKAYRVAEISDALREFKTQLGIAIDAAFESDDSETPLDFARVFRNFNHAAYIIEEMQEDWNPVDGLDLNRGLDTFAYQMTQKGMPLEFGMVPSE